MKPNELHKLLLKLGFSNEWFESGHITYRRKTKRGVDIIHVWNEHIDLRIDNGVNVYDSFYSILRTPAHLKEYILRGIL